MIITFVFIVSNTIKKILLNYYICYLFILFHEASHVFVASLFGKEINFIKISLAGVSINIEKRSNSLKSKADKIKNIVIFLAGPLSNFVLAFLFFKVRMVFEINIFLGLLNLIPIFPLDGYNILKNMLLLFNIKAKTTIYIINLITKFLLLVFFVFGIIQFFVLKSISIIIFFVYLLVLAYCKDKFFVEYNKKML